MMEAVVYALMMVAGWLIGSVFAMWAPLKSIPLSRVNWHWALRKTYYERTTMLDMPNITTAEIVAYSRVDFHQHYQAIVHGKNPWLLYPKVHRRRFFRACYREKNSTLTWLKQNHPQTYSEYRQVRRVQERLLGD